MPTMSCRIPALFLLLVVSLPARGQVRRPDDAPTGVAERLLEQIHAVTTIVDLQMSAEQFKLLAGASRDIGAKCAMLQAKHDAQTAELLPRMQRVLQLYEAGQTKAAEQEKNIVREKIEDIEEELEAGLSGLAEEAIPTYVQLTEYQRAVGFNEYLAGRSTGLHLDELISVPQASRDASIEEIADTLVSEAGVVDEQGALKQPPRDKVLAILKEAGACSYDTYKTRRDEFVSQIVALYPPRKAAVSMDALRGFVEFLACPDLGALLSAMQRVAP